MVTGGFLHTHASSCFCRKLRRFGGINRSVLEAQVSGSSLMKKLEEYGISRSNAPLAALLLPMKAVLYLVAVSFMVNKLGPIQIQVMGISTYAMYTEGTDWFLAILSNDMANKIVGLEKLMDKLLFKVISDVIYIILQVAGSAVFFMVLILVFGQH